MALGWRTGGRMELQLRTVGDFIVERELTEADRHVPAGNPVQTLKRVGDRHHALARMLAEGVAEGEAGAILGYSSVRVSILKQDPMFRELLGLYRNKAVSEYDRVAEKIYGLTNDAAAELQNRLEEAPEAFSVPQLLDIATKMGDRAGYGPTSKQETVNLNVTLSERLEKGRLRAKEALSAETD